MLKRVLQKNFGYEITKMRRVIKEYLAALESMKIFSIVINVSLQIQLPDSSKFNLA